MISPARAHDQARILGGGVQRAPRYLSNPEPRPISRQEACKSPFGQHFLLLVPSFPDCSVPHVIVQAWLGQSPTLSALNLPSSDLS